MDVFVHVDQCSPQQTAAAQVLTTCLSPNSVSCLSVISLCVPDGWGLGLCASHPPA